MVSRRDFLRLAILGTAFSPVASLARRFDEPQAFVGADVFQRLRSKVPHFLSPIGQTVGAVGTELIGTPYVGSTLELYDDREVCCVNFAGLDCVTFYEASLCFARMLRNGGTKPADLLKEVTFTRYRAGKIDGYLSRLHYTSDWIEDNERKGVVKNLSSTLPGAVRMDKKFDFMSTHGALYRQLKANPSWLPRMTALEDEITARKPWYVPNEHVAEAEPMLQTGDIVGIATSAAGLDCSHTGLVYVDENKVARFLNASSVKKQVVLGERLSEYAMKYKKNLGVMIARPL